MPPVHVQTPDEARTRGARIQAAMAELAAAINDTPGELAIYPEHRYRVTVLGTVTDERGKTPDGSFFPAGKTVKAYVSEANDTLQRAEVHTYTGRYIGRMQYQNGLTPGPLIFELEGDADAPRSMAAITETDVLEYEDLDA